MSLHRLYDDSLVKIRQRRDVFDALVRQQERRSTIPAAALKYRNPRAVDALYYSPVEKKKRSAAASEREEDRKVKEGQWCLQRGCRTRIGPSEQEELGDRLCDGSLAKKKQLNDATERKVYPEPPPLPKLSKRQVRAVGERLCNASMAHKAEQLERLREKHLWNPKPAKDRAL